jgi:hypothetical protein
MRLQALLANVGFANDPNPESDNSHGPGNWIKIWHILHQSEATANTIHMSTQPHAVS